MLRLFKKRKKTSLFDRRFYSEQLGEVLIQPKLENVKKAYKLFSTEANEKNFTDIISYINSSSYFRLSMMGNRMPWVEDDLGERPAYVSTYQLYLLITKDNTYYLALLNNVLEGKNELNFIKKVHPFLYSLIFSTRRLIYPV